AVRPGRAGGHVAGQGPGRSPPAPPAGGDRPGTAGDLQPAVRRPRHDLHAAGGSGDARLLPPPRTLLRHGAAGRGQSVAPRTTTASGGISSSGSSGGCEIGSARVTTVVWRPLALASYRAWSARRRASVGGLPACGYR